MDSAFSKLINLSINAQRAIALLLLGLVCLIGLAIVLMVINHFNNQAVMLQDLRETAGRLQLVADQRAALTASPDSQTTNQLILEQSLTGETASVARAALQNKFSAIAQNMEANVVSVGNAPDFERDNIQFIGLSANISGDLQAIHKTIFALETASPPLFFQNVSVRASGNRNNSANNDVELTAQLQLFGAFLPSTNDDSENTNDDVDGLTSVDSQ